MKHRLLFFIALLGAYSASFFPAAAEILESRTVRPSACVWVSASECATAPPEAYVEYLRVTDVVVGGVVYDGDALTSSVLQLSSSSVAVYSYPRFHRSARFAPSTIVELATSSPLRFEVENFSPLSFFARPAYALVASSTNSGSSAIVNVSPNDNTSAGNYLYSGQVGGVTEWRSVLSFTTPASLGSTTSAVLHLFRFEKSTNAGGYYNQIFLSSRNFVESEVTWNKYTSSANWTTPGGDYSGSSLGQFAVDSTALNTWETAELYNVDEWSTRYNFVMKINGGSGSYNYVGYRSGDYSPQPAYLEIRYDVAEEEPPVIDYEAWYNNRMTLEQFAPLFIFACAFIAFYLGFKK